MFAIISGQSPFIIQYLHKAHVRLGLRGPLWEGGRGAAAGLPSPLQFPHLIAGYLSLASGDAGACRYSSAF